MRFVDIMCQVCGQKLGERYTDGYVVGQVMLTAMKPLGQFRNEGITIWNCDIAQHFEAHNLMRIQEKKTGIGI
jgi:hypothetical protein